MALVIRDLADAINNAIAAKDKDGHLISTTSEMAAYAKAVIDTLIGGSVSNASGTVTGTGIPITPATPSPDNTFSGTATTGIMALTDTSWISDMTTGFPGADSSSISNNASKSVNYLISDGVITFSSITGLDTATNLPPASPTSGILSQGTGTNGLISGLTGASWNTALMSPGPLGPTIYSAISNYIISNATVAYASGDVTGTFAPGAGPLTLGAASSGTIS